MNAAEYRQRAAECRKQAKAARDRVARQELIELAQEYEREAAIAEAEEAQRKP